jgi:uncharacterized membrane protein YkgB
MALLGIAIYIIASVGIVLWGSKLVAIAILPVLTLACGMWTLLVWNKKRWSEHIYQLLGTKQETVDSLAQQHESNYEQWIKNSYSQNSLYAASVMLGCMIIIVSIEAIAILLVLLAYLLNLAANYADYTSVILLFVGFVGFVYGCYYAFQYLMHASKETVKTVSDWVRHQPFHA